MDIEKENLAFIGRYDPELLSELRPVRPEMSAGASKKGPLTLLVNGVPVHSKYDPRKEAEKLTAGEPCPLHLHFGFGLGHLAFADSSLNGQILVFEPDAAMATAAMGLVPLAELEKRHVRLFCNLERFEIAVAAAINREMPIKKVVNPYHRERFPNSLIEFENAVRKAELTLRSRRQTQHNRGPLFTEAALRAFPHSWRLGSVERLRDCFAGVPAVILSAGASLQRNLPDLIPFSEHVLIFSMARTAPLLDSLGIRPHFLVHNEAGAFSHTIENCANLDETLFLLCNHAETAFFRRAGARALCYQMGGNQATTWLKQRFPWFEHWTIESGGSVANEAFSLALLAGCGPILLLGQDLSWTGSHFYAEPETNRDPNYAENQICEVPGYFGGQVKTFSSYFSYRQWFALRAAALAKSRPELLLYNATEGGAEIPGFQRISLRDAARRYCKTPIPRARLLELSSLSQGELKERGNPGVGLGLAQGELRRLRTKLLEANRVAAALLRLLARSPFPELTFQAEAEKLDRLGQEYQQQLSQLSVLNGFMEKRLWEIQNQAPHGASLGPNSGQPLSGLEQIRQGLQTLVAIQTTVLESGLKLEGLLTELTEQTCERS